MSSTISQGRWQPKYHAEDAKTQKYIRIRAPKVNGNSKFESLPNELFLDILDRIKSTRDKKSYRELRLVSRRFNAVIASQFQHDAILKLQSIDLGYGIKQGRCGIHGYITHINTAGYLFCSEKSGLDGNLTCQQATKLEDAKKTGSAHPTPTFRKKVEASIQNGKDKFRARFKKSDAEGALLPPVVDGELPETLSTVRDLNIKISLDTTSRNMCSAHFSDYLRAHRKNFTKHALPRIFDVMPRLRCVDVSAPVVGANMDDVASLLKAICKLGARKNINTHIKLIAIDDPMRTGCDVMETCLMPLADVTSLEVAVAAVAEQHNITREIESALRGCFQKCPKLKEFAGEGGINALTRGLTFDARCSGKSCWICIDVVKTRFSIGPEGVVFGKFPLDVDDGYGVVANILKKRNS